MSNVSKAERHLIHTLAGSMSNREIARQVFGKESRESTVRYLLANTEPEVTRGNPARILVLDIETAPCIGYFWGRWKQNISQDQVIEESYVLCWAAKWLDSTEMMWDAINQHPEYQEDPENDIKVIESLSSLIAEADIVVAHNGKNFDIPIVKTRMLYHGMPPMPPFAMMDTLTVARREFRFPSNALNSLATYLGLGEKVKHSGFRLWRGVVEGCKKSWNTMIDYNIQDVNLLEDIYLVLRPWDSRHPNVGLFGALDEVCCPCCGSTNVKETGDYDITHVSKFPVLQCGDCGATKSTRFTVLSKDQRNNILRNIR